MRATWILEYYWWTYKYGIAEMLTKPTAQLFRTVLELWNSKFFFNNSILNWISGNILLFFNVSEFW